MGQSVLSQLSRLPPQVRFSDMSISFMNMMMLAGLGVLVLPVLAHLLSKRRYEVVEWGAMQFLELGRKTKRQIRLQDLFLLLLRMLLLAGLVGAMARPYGQGSFFNLIGKQVSRDLVFVIDGSGSTGWTGGKQTPHALAVQWVREAVEDLNPGDTVSLIDARSQNRKLIHPPTTSMSLVRKTLDSLPDSTGTSDLTEGIIDAIRILSTTSNVTREVIVLTDGQAFPWHTDDSFGMQRVNDALKQPAITPSISIVNLAELKKERSNCSVGNIELSRQMTVPGFPIKIRTTIRQSGGESIQKVVSLAVNGQPKPEADRTVNLLANGEALVEFDHAFPSTGYFRVSISIDHDDLPQDDQSDAIIAVEDGIPVLLVDGAPNIDQPQSETFFLRSAFASSGEDSPWVRTTTITPDELTLDTLQNHRVVFLCNTESITPAQQLELIDFTIAGGGVVFAPGDNISSLNWNEFFVDETTPFLPARLIERKQEDPATEEIVNLDPLSLKAPWLTRFRKEKGVDLWLARFAEWWDVELNHPPADDAAEEDAILPEDSEATDRSRPTLFAEFTNKSPFLIGKQLGDGLILQFTSPLDADWSTLPARNDFVPFIHELVFRLAGVETQHNVIVGQPIQIPLTGELRARDYSVSGPGIPKETPEPIHIGRKSFASFRGTTIPGTYWFEPLHNQRAERIPFVVTDDRSESDLTPLDELGWEILEADDRMTRINSMSDLTQQVQSEHSRTELWWWFLLLLFVILLSEVAMTRKMLQQGHSDLPE